MCCADTQVGRGACRLTRPTLRRWRRRMPPLNSRKRSRCAIPDCSREWHCRDWCKFHYERHRRHGDPLFTPGHKAPAKKFFEQSLPHTGDGCLIWPFARNTDGYAIMAIGGGKSGTVARQMCIRVHGAPPTNKHEAAHSCGKGDEGCIHPGHLSWKTHADNMADTFIHGTDNTGERCGMAKLNGDQVREIKAIGRTQFQHVIAHRYGVSTAAISSILRGRTWRHI